MILYLILAVIKVLYRLLLGARQGLAIPEQAADTHVVTCFWKLEMMPNIQYFKNNHVLQY